MIPANLSRDRGTNALWYPQDNPNLIARLPIDVTDAAGRELAAGITGRLSGALFDLQEDYGINFPSIGMTVPEAVTAPDGSKRLRAFIATARVDGVNMYSHMDDVPRETLLSAFAAVAHYYEDAVTEDDPDRRRFVELSLDQLMYGKAADDTEPKVYLVDIDPWLGNVQAGKNAAGPWFDDGVGKLAGELLAFKRRYPAVDLHGIPERVAKLGTMFGVDVPWALTLGGQ